MLKLIFNNANRALRLNNSITTIVSSRSYIEGLSPSVLNSLNVKKQLKKVAFFK